MSGKYKDQIQSILIFFQFTNTVKNRVFYNIDIEDYKILQDFYLQLVLNVLIFFKPFWLS